MWCSMLRHNCFLFKQWYLSHHLSCNCCTPKTPCLYTKLFFCFWKNSDQISFTLRYVFSKMIICSFMIGVLIKSHFPFSVSSFNWTLWFASWCVQFADCWCFIVWHSPVQIWASDMLEDCCYFDDIRIACYSTLFIQLLLSTFYVFWIGSLLTLY